MPGLQVVGLFASHGCGEKDVLILTGFESCRTDKIESFGEALPMLEFAAAETKKRAPHLTHPHLCLEAIKHGIEYGGLAGLRKVCLQFQLLNCPLPVQN